MRPTGHPIGAAIGIRVRMGRQLDSQLGSRLENGSDNGPGQRMGQRIGQRAQERGEMMDFDNRTVLDRVGLGPGQRLIDRVKGQGALHVICEVGDMTLGYCYIRKNACSSFKRLFLDMGPEDLDPEDWSRPIDFMMSNQMMRSADAPDCDRIVFVYRDPVERIVSLFKNKFIMRDGHEDLFRGYEELAGEAPEKTTFRRFVGTYLRPDLRQLDLHVLPQAWHLKRFQYTDAIPIGDLHARMTGILGSELADRYFARPVNATGHGKTIPVEGAMDIPADDLAATFVQEAVMPANDSLLDAGLKARLLDLYADDVRMIADIEGR